tara:strand:+ start:20095 stop:20637 length:543 start_codon:yes stop_codon:yes gene_type:complete
MEYDGKFIIAKPHTKKRSEAKLQQYKHGHTANYNYSFKLSGQFNEYPCIVLQFHDWWGSRSKKIYAATSPPISFSIRSDQIWLSVNELISTPHWNEERGCLLVDHSHQNDQVLYPIVLDEWIDLSISVKWSMENDGFVTCNNFRIDGIKTAFNTNPCDIQMGLYGQSKFSKNIIRELSCW